MLKRNKYIRRVSGALLLALLLSFAGCSAPAAPTSGQLASPADSAQQVPVQPEQNPSSEQLEISFIDVGQADSILITQGGEAMLVDAGTEGAAADVQSFLTGRGIKTLSYAVGTHPHEDHIGGMAQILDSFPVQNMLLPDAVHTTDAFSNMLDALERHSVPTALPSVGTVYSVGDADVTVLGALKANDLNNSSLVLRITFGDFSCLLQGDAEAEAEQAILDSGVTLKSDVIKSGHHGSNTSTTPAYLAAVNPDVAVISCGAGNSYGHPTPSTLDNLNAAYIETWRTDESGTVVITSDGSGYAVHSAKAPSPVQHTAGIHAAQSARENAAAEQARIEAEQSAAQAEQARIAAEQAAAAQAAAEAEQATAEQSQTVYITRTGAKYHRSGCQYLRKSKIAISLDDAQNQGYDACSKCF